MHYFSPPLKRVSLFLLLGLFFVMGHAVPAKPGFTSVTQSDGTTIQVQTVGDEFHHNFVTTDGLTIAFGDDGDLYYLLPDGITSVRAHNEGARNATELVFLATNRNNLTVSAQIESRERSGMMRSRRAPAGPLRATQVPNNGTPRVPIILVQYTDKAMSNTKAQFVSHYTSLGTKSVRQYFVDQSNGLYDPQFDVYGIYTLPSNRATYGGNNSSGDDKGVAKMVGDAISKAGNDIDWSQYDNDGDGEADVCIVVYAGVGEAQASQTVPSSVWPCQWSLSSGAYYGDGSGAVTRNGTKIDKFAVFNEVNGSSDSGTTMDGIGTFCHEFSHCLGLPDFYETTYRYGYYGMGGWSLMNSGSYNGITIDGDTPIGYSAYEKNFMGWIDYITPVENTYYTLPVFNSKSLENDQAVKITALNANEYWVLENRKKQGWDYCIADEGVLITHFTYVADRWTANTVNNQSVQLATIIPADNSLSTNNENKDLYGETNHAFTTTSSPAMKANMSANGSLSSSTGGAGTVNKPVTEITLNSDGSASFWYIKGQIPSLSAPVLADASDVQYTSFVATWTHTPTVSCTYTLQVLQGNTTVLNQTGITAKNYNVTGLEAGKTYTFKVKAVPVNTSQATESAWSNVKTVTLPEIPVPTITANPTSLSFGTVNVGSNGQATFTVTG
ncbi:MAG: M6 family metalloprotease domain-containing protein, partial [Muribaculaceae bacterium]|nr:M6 family metalloprotease domain-containing protein [Muribaculaceae bacterium]